MTNFQSPISNPQSPTPQLPNSPPPNALTIDLEDWYQGLSSTSQQVERWPEFEARVVPATQKLLSILRQHGTRATFFTLGYLADQFPDLIGQVADEGHELALHGYHHTLLYRLAPDQLRAELERGRRAVEAAAGRPVRLLGYRAPMYSLGSAPWALDLVHQAGFGYDSSLYPVFGLLRRYLRHQVRSDDLSRPQTTQVVTTNTRSDDLSRPPTTNTSRRFPYRLPNGLVEFPLTTLRLAGVNLPIAGGVYLRLLPYPWLRWGLRRANAAGQPGIIYLHPWDLDPDQPRRPLTARTLRERFTHYVNLRQTEAKLRALLRDFNFAPAAEVLAWCGLPVQEPPLP